MSPVLRTPVTPHAAAWRGPWLRRGVGLLLALCLYRLGVWCFLHSIDQEHLKDGIEDWAHARLYTDVSIARTEMGLNVLGRGRLTARELEIANPDMVAFAGNLVSARRVDLICPAWGFLGFRVKPRCVLHDLALNLSWNGTGASNFAGLGRVIGAPPPPPAFPLGRLNARTFFCELRRNRIVLERPARGVRLRMRVDGNIVYDIRKRKGWGELVGADLRGMCASRRIAPARAGVRVERFSFRYGSELGRLPRLRAAVVRCRNLPPALLPALWPQLPDLPPAALFSGEVRWQSARLSLHGSVAGMPVAGLGIAGGALPLQLACSLDPGKKSQLLRLTARPAAGAPETLRATVRLGADGAYVLGVRCRELDLGALPPRLGGVPAWLRPTLLACRRVDFVAARTRLGLLPGAVCAMTAGGSLRATARRATGPVGNAPTGKAGKIAWVISATIADFEVQTAAAGVLVRELAGVSRAAYELERLRRRALGLAAPVALPALPVVLRFSRLDIACRVFVDNGMVLTLDGRSPALGRLTAGFRLARGRDGRPRGKGFVCLRQVPPDLLRARGDGVAPDVERALRSQAARPEGLRLNFVIAVGDDGRSRCERRYLQDAFMLLTRIMGKKRP